MNDTTFQEDGKVAYVPVVANAKPKPTTNADRIRAMTDEELAGWLAKHNERSAVCPNFGARDCQASCRKCWLDWLKQEASE
jgi:hypothetical protein